jgi:K+-sensing histidine kinase KdpD
MRGDPSLLFEAVGNLVDNALKFTPRGGRVTVRGFSGSDTIGFEVIDSGPGIPPEEVPCVLRRFYRTESSRHTAGSGLGLALVAAVAQLHGMDLAIGDAQPGCRVTLARRQDVFAPAGKPVPETAPGHPQPATGHPAALMEAREPGRQPDTRDGSA